MAILTNFEPYIQSLKREIELQVQEQITAGNIKGKIVTNGSSIKYKSSGHVDIVYIKETQRYKSVYFPGATGISIKTHPKAKQGIMAVYIGKKGKTHEIAILDHKFLSDFVDQEIFMMEANFLFLSMLQQQMLETCVELEKNNKSADNLRHLKKIIDYLTGIINISYEGKEVIKPDFPLNDAQFKAYSRILNLTSDQFLTVIHGPPGTGKTQVIASAITALLKQEKSILITSHTNVAVDNALEKLVNYLSDQNIKPENFLWRVGNPLRADTELMVPFYKEKHPDIGLYKDGLVVGATLSSLLVLANQREFNFSSPIYDYVFLDEASMANFPQTLTAMVMADKVVLLGDPHQLPPIVRDEKATQDVLTSLFEKIIEKDPSVFTFLDIQYRSHPSIANYSSLVFYNGELQSHPSTSEKGLTGDIPDKILDGDNHLIWIDSLKQGRLKWKKLSGSYSGYNIYEAAIIGCLIKKFAVHGLNIGKDIRIITPFRLQAAIIEQLVREEFETLIDLYESQTFPSASTIDRIQGREASIVLVSLVDDGQNWRIHQVLQDYRRINVGLTRAKNKMIIVGSSLLKSSTAPIAYFRTLGEYIEQKGTTVTEIDGCDLKYFTFAAEEALKLVSKQN